jgi:hypothetical protein
MKLKKVILLLLICLPVCLQASVEVIGSLKHKYNVTQGETIKGVIKLKNQEAEDQEVRIYQTDMLYNYTERFFYDEPGSHKRSNANWIEYSPKTLIIKANEVRDLVYEIKVPNYDSLNGSFWSIMMVEGVNPIDPAQTGDLTISTVTRYAVQMITEMQNKGKGLLEYFEPTLVRKDDNKLFLAIDIVNNGDYYISPEVKVQFYDEQGKLVKTLVGNAKGIYPTTSTRFLFDLEGLPSGHTYNAMIVAAGSEEDVFGLEYVLYF